MNGKGLDKVYGVFACQRPFEGRSARSCNRKDRMVKSLHDMSIPFVCNIYLLIFQGGRQVNKAGGRMDNWIIERRRI